MSFNVFQRLLNLDSWSLFLYCLKPVKKVRRRSSRELALKLLFQREFFSETHQNDGGQGFFEDSAVDEYAQVLVKGVSQNKVKIDKIIKKLSHSWSSQRIFLIDLNILRISLFEILIGGVPPRVTINEALNISKKYSTEDSASFINGVLDRAMKTKQELMM